MKKSRLKASALRTTMSVALFLIIGFSTIGFYFAQDWLSKFATEDDNNSNLTVNDSAQATKDLQTDVTNHQAYADKANSMIASSQGFQSQVMEDLNKYATINGISITDYNVEQSSASVTSVAGLQSNRIKITLGSPVAFNKLMQFLKSIESNLPKIQLTSINLSGISSSNDNVTIDPLTIEVYVK